MGIAVSQMALGQQWLYDQHFLHIFGSVQQTGN